jgi:hypothetical protein
MESLMHRLRGEGLSEEAAIRQAEKLYPESETFSRIIQIKGKGNRAPKEEYLPFVQDFVKNGNWSQINDVRNAGLRRYTDVFNDAEQRKIEALNLPVPDHYWLTGDQIQTLHNAINPEGKRLKYNAYGNIVGDEAKYASGGLAKGGEVKMQAGGLGKVASKGAAKAAAKVARTHTDTEIEEMARRMSEQVLGQQTGTFVRQGESPLNPAGKSRALWEREQNTPVEIEFAKKQKPAPVVKVEDLKDAWLLGVAGDPSIGGLLGTKKVKGSDIPELMPSAILRSVAGVDIPEGVGLYGGPRYGDKKKYWASNLSAASRVQNIANELGQEAPVYGQYMKMTPQSMDFAMHNLHTLLSTLQPEKLDKSKLGQLNELVRQNDRVYGAFPSFAGFEKPEDVLLQAGLNSDLRKKITNILWKPKFTEPLGLRSGKEISNAIQHPELQNLETGASGFSIGKMVPGVNLRDFPSAHPTYSHDIPGEFIGMTKYPVPYELAFPVMTQEIKQNLKPGVDPFSMLKMSGAKQRVDDPYIEQIRKYEDFMKKFTGKKKGGAVKMAGGGALGKAAAKAASKAKGLPEVEGMVAKMGEEGRMPIVPVPNRWFLQPDKFPQVQPLVEKILETTGKSREDFFSGAFVNPRTGEVLDSRVMEDVGVVINPVTGKPMMSGKQSGLETLDPKLGSFTKSNLVRKSLFKPTGGDPLLEQIPFVATIEKGGPHFYGLSTEYASPAEMWNTMKGDNPTLRPKSRGDLFGMGDVVGTVRLGSGPEHEVYEKLFVAPKGSDVPGKLLKKRKGGKVSGLSAIRK